MDVLTGQADSRPDWHQRCLAAALLLAALVRLLLLDAYPLMDTTEARYAEIAREMVATGDWITPQLDPGVPFWAKPPLSIWLTALSLATFGGTALAARLPHFLLCSITCLLVFRFGRTERDAPDGLLAAVILATTPVFFVSAGAVMTDATLALGTTLAMTSFWRSVNAERPSVAARYGFFVGLAIGLLAKGPVALFITLLPVGAWTILARRGGDVGRRMPWARGALLTAAVAAPWYNCYI